MLMLRRERNPIVDDIRHPAGARRGSALVTVLVIVVMLALAAYSFTEFMLVELQATDRYEREVQSRALADSGAEYIAAVLGTRAEQTIPINFYHNPDMFREVVLIDADHNRRRGRFSIVATTANDGSGGAVRYGLVDESSKLNVNQILEFDLDEEQQRDMLLALPDMTVEIADAILDWIDDDEEPRQFGAENEYYGALSPPYSAANTRLESLEELLRVRGVTYSLLYGEDWNRNGLFDAEENDGDVVPPYDNADGVLQLGWAAYLTVDSREANLRRDGQPRINVNQSDLAALYDAVLAEFDEETALFVTAFRLTGPAGGSGGGQGGGLGEGEFSVGSGSGSRGGDITMSLGNSASVDSNTITGVRLLATSFVVENRGGLEISSGGQYEVTSLYELIGATVEAQVNGQRQELTSPWENDPTALTEALPRILDIFTTTDEEFIPGRVNISQAPREVLMAVPEMDEELVLAILGEQTSAFGASPETDPLRLTSGWLLTQGIVDLEEIRALDPYISGGGDLFKAQIVGYFDEGPSATRLEVVIDATQTPPRILSVRDLTNLGPGYTRDHFQ